ncbi:glutamine cyclotransferase [Tribonema minus]|uniref:Glutamine cyclotransferase n=1 Tax=Tribonema minus TaxID=303371 RepID=A0A835Z6R5_9STRA|nr:glutamine cyclotransferase [Tribonema minus]
MATSRRHAYCSQATILCHFVLLWLVCGLGWSFAVPRNFASSLQNALDTLGKKGESSESGRGLREEEGGPALSVGVAAAQYEVLKVYDHDASAFTQGLGWYQGKLYESTGMQGQSEVRIIDLETGEVLKRQQLPSYVFGEGMVIHEGIVHQITWHHKQGYAWNATTLEPTHSFQFETTNGEGWGITSDGTHLIASDGSSNLHFWDPVTYKTTRKVPVTLRGQPVARLNELEYVKGRVLANVWFSDEILAIDPLSGRVVEVLDFAALYPRAQRAHELTSHEAVLNGIAYDAQEDVLYLTGKLWPRLYKVRLL